MSKTKEVGSVMPLAGGDYIDTGDGPKPYKPGAEAKTAKAADKPTDKPAKPAPATNP